MVVMETMFSDRCVCGRSGYGNPQGTHVSLEETLAKDSHKDCDHDRKPSQWTHSVNTFNEGVHIY